MSKWQAIAIASLYVLAGSAGSAGAQEPQQSSPPAAQGPTLKVETRNVLVDVVVTDKKGKAISGLPKDTFEIAEDGVTQQIVSFEEDKAAPPSSLALPNMPSNVFTNFPTINTSDSVNVLLLDTLNTDPADQVYVRKQMTEYLKTVRQGTQVALFALGSQLQLVRGFTADYAGRADALIEHNAGGEHHRSPSYETRALKDEGPQ